MLCQPHRSSCSLFYSIQSEKPNTLGSTPKHAVTTPALLTQQCAIPVDLVVAAAFRGYIPASCDESMPWAVDNFDTAASNAYRILREPSLDNLAYC